MPNTRKEANRRWQGVMDKDREDLFDASPHFQAQRGLGASENYAARSLARAERNLDAQTEFSRCDLLAKSGQHQLEAFDVRFQISKGYVRLSNFLIYAPTLQ